MTKSVAIYGAKGSIGKRWVAIFKYLNCNVVEIDCDSSTIAKKVAHVCDYAVIATPTNTHISMLKHCLKYDYNRILCEKPLSQLDRTKDFKILKDNPKIVVVNNWQYVFDDEELKIGKHNIEYNYFNCGKEDVYCNCFQPLAFAQDIMISNNLPVFSCLIDNKTVTQAMFDESYIILAKKFISNKKCGFNYEEYCKASSNARDW